MATPQTGDWLVVDPIDLCKIFRVIDWIFHCFLFLNHCHLIYLLVSHVEHMCNLVIISFKNYFIVLECFMIISQLHLKVFLLL